MLWSPEWTYPGSYPDFMLDSGDLATLTYNGTGSYISIQGGATARILRSDIPLQNGVMHVSPALYLNLAVYKSSH